MKRKPFKPEPYWLLHHGILLEWTTEPVSERIRYIKQNKPEHEIPIRLRWLKKVKNPSRLPRQVVLKQAAYDGAQAAYDRARAAYDRAQAAYDRAWAAYDRARAAYDGARAAYDGAVDSNYKQIAALHKEECPGCPFSYRKRTLFP